MKEMKRSTNRTRHCKMRFSRLLMYLFLVAIFGFLSSFVTDNYSQTRQAEKSNRLNNDFQEEQLMTTTASHADIPRVRL